MPSDISDLIETLENYKTLGSDAISNSIDFAKFLELLHEINGTLDISDTQDLIKEMRNWAMFESLDFLSSSINEEFAFEHLLLLATFGKQTPSLFLNFHAFSKLAALITETSSRLKGSDAENLKVCFISLELASKIMFHASLTSEELAMFPDHALNALIVHIFEESGNDENAISFLMAIHYQHFVLGIPSPVVKKFVDSSMISMRTELARALVMLFNRADEVKMQESLIDLLAYIYKECGDFFYTNDNTVIFDITLREVMRVQDDQEKLRHSMMNLLPLILFSVPLESPGGTYSNLKLQMLTKLELIFRSSATPETTKSLAERILIETK